MIVSMPDDGVSAPRLARGSNGTDNRDAHNQAPPVVATQSPARGDAFGRTLQTLVNVTIDCVRGRYDR